MPKVSVFCKKSREDLEAAQMGMGSVLSATPSPRRSSELGEPLLSHTRVRNSMMLNPNPVGFS